MGAGQPVSSPRHGDKDRLCRVHWSLRPEGPQDLIKRCKGHWPAGFHFHTVTCFHRQEIKLQTTDTSGLQFTVYLRLLGHSNAFFVGLEVQMGRMQRRITAPSFSAGTGHLWGPWSGFPAQCPCREQPTPLGSSTRPAPPVPQGKQPHRALL